LRAIGARSHTNLRRGGNPFRLRDRIDSLIPFAETPPKATLGKQDGSKRTTRGQRQNVDEVRHLSRRQDTFAGLRTQPRRQLREVFDD
jgi:hypothetical protein